MFILFFWLFFVIRLWRLKYFQTLTGAGKKWRYLLSRRNSSIGPRTVSESQKLYLSFVMRNQGLMAPFHQIFIKPRTLWANIDTRSSQCFLKVWMNSEHRMLQSMLCASFRVLLVKGKKKFLSSLKSSRILGKIIGKGLFIYWELQQNLRAFIQGDNSIQYNFKKLLQPSYPSQCGQNGDMRECLSV